MYCFIGVLLGTLIGVLPGIGPIATISMLLPATFVLPPVSALIMLAGIYYGAQYGGSTTAILVNLPGEVSSVVTCLDGYQMARQGNAGKALGVAALGSFFAGSVATVLIAASPAARGARAQVRSRRLLLADGARPDRRGGAGARLDHQGDRDDRAGPARSASSAPT
jgi:TctA family transporter